MTTASMTSTNGRLFERSHGRNDRAGFHRAGDTRALSRYAMSVIPVRRRCLTWATALKPVQRRILYTMYHDLGLDVRGPAPEVREDRRRRHRQLPPSQRRRGLRGPGPHGPELVLREPLVHPQGNFGSVGGDEPAARTLHRGEVDGHRLGPHGGAARQHGRNAGQLRQHAPGTRSAAGPVPEPARQWSVRHRRRVATTSRRTTWAKWSALALLLIADPEATTASLLDRVKGPDFPLGGEDPLDRATLRRIYEDGTGTIKVQGNGGWRPRRRRQQIVDVLDPRTASTRESWRPTLGRF